jgi:hypothetical protein
MFDRGGGEFGDGFGESEWRLLLLEEPACGWQAHSVVGGFHGTRLDLSFDMKGPFWEDGRWRGAVSGAPMRGNDRSGCGGLPSCAFSVPRRYVLRVRYLSHLVGCFTMA